MILYATHNGVVSEDDVILNALREYAEHGLRVAAGDFFDQVLTVYLLRRTAVFPRIGALYRRAREGYAAVLPAQPMRAYAPTLRSRFVGAIRRAIAGQ